LSHNVASMTQAKLSNPSNPRVFFNVDVLYPKLQNFCALYTGAKITGPTTGKPPCFKGCPLHRIIKNLMTQGGDFSKQNGTGGESICGEKLEGENFRYKHNEEGLLSMAKAGSNTNSLQFITTVLTPHLDGKHIVMGVAKILENVEVKGEKPAQLCVIAECGEMNEGDDQEIFPRDESGDSHPDFPKDADNWQMAIKKYTKVLRYVEGSRAAAEDADGAKLQPVTSSCVLNISTSKRKMSDQQGAVDSCLEALEIDPSNTKALWKYVQALAGFKKAQEIAPEDKAIQAELLQVKQKIKAQKDKEKAAHAKMFA
uniref:PPIase cyclophilin-type domain-containing protein n=1 Tax=Capra hircus TaxID=9925 RepID=A0A452FIK3_CAPHI